MSYPPFKNPGEDDNTDAEDVPPFEQTTNPLDINIEIPGSIVPADRKQDNNQSDDYIQIHQKRMLDLEYQEGVQKLKQGENLDKLEIE